MKLENSDLSILRGLGKWAAGEAASERNREKIAAWYAHDAGAANRRVMVLAETDYLSDDRKPVTESDLACVDPWARGIERRLRQRQYEVEVLKDDHVVSTHIEYAPCLGAGTDFGIPSGKRHNAGGSQLSFHYVPPLVDLDDADFAKLRHRTFQWDQDREALEKQRLQSVFDDILPIRRRTPAWTFGMPLTSTLLDMVGLDQFMVLIYDNPQGLHRLMAFLRDDMLLMNQFLETQGLYDLNNEADYVGAGSMGFTHALPSRKVDGNVMAQDRWFLSESQESVGISPEQYGEFVYPYLKDVASKFGRVYYGCCEPADPIIACLETMPNLARVSVSPWADEKKMGDFCRARKVAYSRKPTPNILSGERFDETAQREVIARTMAAASGCSLEMIQRDVYTTNNQPERFIRWVEICREEAVRWRAS